jgi:hypothetical protein
MLVQILVGASVGALNIVVHALLTVSTIRAARRTAASHNTLRPWLRLVAIMVAAVLMLMMAHMAEVFVWAAAYALTGTTPDNADPTYFAFVNYTTLGYGDILPVARWRLLGPMTAMNGVLLFGWSTAVIFEVLRKTISEHAAFASPT